MIDTSNPDGSATVTRQDIDEAKNAASLYKEKGIPTSLDYVVEMERDDVDGVYRYKWWRIQ